MLPTWRKRMGNYTITIDSGTTNTRVFLFEEDGTLTASFREETGVRDTAADGNNAKLKKAVKNGIQDVLRSAQIRISDVRTIIASGMITSNVGLVEIPHLNAPAGLEELARGTRKILLEEICEQPIYFIPGVKNPVSPITTENFLQMDIMRGEETETMALLCNLSGIAGSRKTNDGKSGTQQDFPEQKPRIFLLPGSHSKFVFTDEKNRITGCLTSLTGELLDAVTRHTILSDAVGGQFVSEENYDAQMVIAGYDAASSYGTGRACFTARILNQFVEKDKVRIANYLLGVVLQNDLYALKSSLGGWDAAAQIQKEPAKTQVPAENTQTYEIIVSGRNPLRRALHDLLKHDGFFRNISEYVPDPGLPLSAQGAMLIGKLLN